MTTLPPKGTSGPDERSAPDHAIPWSESVRGLVRAHPDGDVVAAGDLVVEIIDGHGHYLGSGQPRGAVAGRGPARTVREHLAHADGLWDGPADLTGRHVILALALDPDVGGPLLLAGDVASLLGRWTIEEHDDLGPMLVWDLLSSQGRALADEQPLLAAALGAPAEWSVPVPEGVTRLVWAPFGDRLAFHHGGGVHEVGRAGTPRRIGTPEGELLSLGWGAGGVVALRRRDASVEVVRAADGTVVGDVGDLDVDTGALAADGSVAWLSSSAAIESWVPGTTVRRRIGDPGSVLALDGAGRRGLVERRGHAVLTSPETTPGPHPGDIPALGPDGGVHPPCVLVDVGGEPFVAAADDTGGLRIGPAGGPVTAAPGTGPAPVTAAAVDPTGTLLAVVTGGSLAVWPIQLRRATTRAVPAYDTDSGGTGDLLGTNRDATAVAALLASAVLKPPLAIGLFGAWGSGKSFVLREIEHLLGQLTGEDRPAGFLGRVRVVPFNAWQYAEVNLWASLVDEVLRAIGPAVRPAPDSTQAVDAAKATADAAEAQAALERKTQELVEAEHALRAASHPARRWAVVAAAAAVAVLAGAVALALLTGASAAVVTGFGAVLTALAATVAAIAEGRRVVDQGREVTQAARDAGETASRVRGLLGARARAEQEVLVRRTELQAAQETATRLGIEAQRRRDLAESPSLGAVLQRMSTLTEYRDQLSLVTRTRERFQAIDRAVAATRGEVPSPDGGPVPDPGIERVVILIDDLDRCPPEKVVSVLEAVHLLFDFEMFVVLIAVDTRWLEQSLKIRYRQLLGEPGGAEPSDYLEKIIQIPLHLRPLDEELVRTMTAGLIGAAAPLDPGPVAAPAGVPGADPATRVDHRRSATTPRPQRAPLPVEALRITPAEAAALSDVAPLVGTTPRTVKRFINIYRLLKTRAVDSARFDERRDGLGDHEVVAFLLATVTGAPAVAARVLGAIARSVPGTRLDAVVTGACADHPDDPPAGVVLGWLASRPRYGAAPADRFASWASEVGRFSFTPPA